MRYIKFELSNASCKDKTILYTKFPFASNDQINQVAAKELKYYKEELKDENAILPQCYCAWTEISAIEYLQLQGV